MSRVNGRTADVLGAAFYGGVACVALAGQTTAAVSWLGWPVESALPAVTLLELGGIVLAARSDFRRRLGEQAIAARTLSAAVAIFAVVFNWLGHTNHLQGGFYAGMSALGYLVWLIQAGERRRDHLRAAGKLPPTPPVYGTWRWLRHPARTARARALALADPTLGLYGSLAAVRDAEQAEQEAVRQRRRQAAISDVLRRKITASADKTTAEIAITVFDLDEIAARLAASADYDGLTALIGADLMPARLLAGDVAMSETTAPGGPAAVPLSAHVAPVVLAQVRRSLTDTVTAPVPVNASANLAEVTDGQQVESQQANSVIMSAPRQPRTTESAQPRARRHTPTVADKVTAYAERHPDAAPAVIAKKLGVTERTVRRHLAARAAGQPTDTDDVERVNGTEVPALIKTTT